MDRRAGVDWRFLTLACATSAALLLASCSDDARAPAPTRITEIAPPAAPAPQPPSTLQWELVSFELPAPVSFDDRGQNVGGLVRLGGPAPSEGFVVTLSSSHPEAAWVPDAVTLRGGLQEAAVPVLTRAVSTITDVTITASARGVAIARTLRVTPSDTFFSFASAGHSRRYTPEVAAFTAAIDGNLRTLTIAVETLLGGHRWNISLQAPWGGELRVGTYDNASRLALLFHTPDPGMDFTLFGGCGSIRGSFVVIDALYGPGPSVERFHAMFAQECATSSAP